MTEKKRILYVVPSLSKANGISTFCVNYLKKIDFRKYKIDFLVMNSQSKDYYDLVKKYDCDIYEMNFNKKNLFRKISTIKEIKNLLKNKKYDIIHCHTPNFGAITQLYAKKYGINKRILHAHAVTSSAKILNRIRNSIIEPLAIKNSNVFLSCSIEAGKARFGNKKFIIVNNSLNKDDYFYDLVVRNNIRNKLDLSKNNIVLGTVGRLSKDKNQRFLIDLLKILVKEDKNYKLLIVGGGPEEKKLKKYVEECSLQNHVIFTGVRKDVNDIYNAMDMFLLPSLAEGFGLVLIEAQMTGLKCIASKNRVPEKTKFTDLLDFLPIEDGPKKWANYIKKNVLDYNRKTRNIEFDKSDFNIDNQVNELEKIYDGE